MYIFYIFIHICYRYSYLQYCNIFIYLSCSLLLSIVSSPCVYNFTYIYTCMYINEHVYLYMYVYRGEGNFYIHILEYTTQVVEDTRVELARFIRYTRDLKPGTFTLLPTLPTPVCDRFFHIISYLTNYTKHHTGAIILILLKLYFI